MDRVHAEVHDATRHVREEGAGHGGRTGRGRCGRGVHELRELHVLHDVIDHVLHDVVDHEPSDGRVGYCGGEDVCQRVRTCPLYSHLATNGDRTRRDCSWFFVHQSESLVVDPSLVCAEELCDRLDLLGVLLDAKLREEFDDEDPLEDAVPWCASPDSSHLED